MLFIIAISSLYLAFSYYLKNTKEVPSYEGEYIEGMAGQPRFINPILSPANDLDSDLSTLIYSSLLKLDSAGKLVNDLAEKYEISDDRLIYTFYLKKGVRWHNGMEFTADDVVYTIKTLQNNDFNSPLRTSWKGVRVEKIDDYAVQFILKSAYSPFLNNLTLGILPKHIWEGKTANNFALAEYNLSPIGTGPYEFKQFIKDKDGKINSIELIANENCYCRKPFIKKITFRFFNTEEEAISAFNRKEIKGINHLSPKNKKKIIDTGNSNIIKMGMPRYFATFFNQTKSKALSDKTVRLALSYAVNKQRLIEEVLDGEGVLSETPIPVQLLDYNSGTKIYDYAKEHANNILKSSGWIDLDQDGIREKGDIKLKFTLISTDWPELLKTSKILQGMWKEIGAEVEIKNIGINEIQSDYIKNRDYEAILFGEILNFDPDPFAFWHSSQKKDLGLNLALYDNTEADKLLEEARQEIDQNIRAEKYRKFQELVMEDAAAIFLYSPNYLYLQSKAVQGVELKNIVIPSNRFNSVENWYMKTKRVWK